MNDFALKGVTILAHSTEPVTGYYFTLIIAIIAIFLFSACWAVENTEGRADLFTNILCGIIVSLCIASMPPTIHDIKYPDNYYTVLIDDTASYTEVTNTFKEIFYKDGVYTVKLYD